MKCFLQPVRLFIFFAAFLCVPHTPPLAADGVFGSRASRSSNLRAFPKWTGMLDRYFDEAKLKGRKCDSNSLNSCTLGKWKQFLDSIRGQGAFAQVKAVNRYMNSKRYIIDPINWGKPDYWATPYQFFSKDGDCEDYAISKFMSLRALGFSNDQMRIVILNDNNLKVLHAVLVVYLDGTPYVLDNQIKQVVPASRIRHYSPIYSINEDHWWRHR